MPSSDIRTGSPCGACKFLRRKCLPDCVFAPYFTSEESPARFAAMHKVFGASNVSKILLQLPVQERYEVVVTMVYEAEARLHDPVYGCVSHIFALQQQVAFLKAQLIQLKLNLTHQSITTIGDMRNRSDMTWQQTSPYKPYRHDNLDKQVLPQSSIESLEHSNASSEVTTNLEKIQTGWLGFHANSQVSYCNNDLSELQALALTMMGN